MPRLSRFRQDRFRNGHSRQGSPDHHAGPDPVGLARATAGRCVPDGVAQICQQPGWSLSASDRSLLAGGSAGSVLRPLHKVLHGVGWAKTRTRPCGCECAHALVPTKHRTRGHGALQTIAFVACSRHARLSPPTPTFDELKATHTLLTTGNAHMTNLPSEQHDEGLSRRGLVQVLAAGAAAGIATPAMAQPRAQSSAIIAEATSADYVRDPTRWGSPEVAALFPGFKHIDMRTKGAIIRLRHGGSGPPLLMLHGYPNNHVLWHALAARLAQNYHVVLPDLRGYGDSSLPDPGPNLINYSFRVMAEDMIEVMANLGHERFFLVGHDRGARLSHRMCLDHPERVMKLCNLDMLPNYHVWTNANRSWALSTWRWLFMAQPEPLPETMISSVPAETWLGTGGVRN